MSVESLTATGYIQHHMQHLQSLHQKVIIDFSVFNYDTLFFSVLAMIVTFLLLRLGAKNATSGVPGKMQCAVEMIVEMVDNQSKNIVHGDRTYIAPLALTVFCWVAIMNSIDLIPVDLFPWMAGFLGIHYLRPLPTADLNGTLGVSLGMLVLLFYYGIKVKGLTGFIIELFTAPFGKHPLLWPVNLLMNIIEYLAKFISLGMRLFGNMYAGELVFFLIALLGGFMLQLGPVGGAAIGLGQVIAGSIWWLFHVLIVLLQAFIFMMLTLVYIGQAHSHH